MPKIIRPDINIKPFANNSQSGERTVFDSQDTSNLLTQNLNIDYLRGLYAIDPDNVQLSAQDLNGILFAISSIPSLIAQDGILEWSATQEYFTGSVARVGNNLYSALRGSTTSPNINNNPVDSQADWANLNSVSQTIQNAVNLNTAHRNANHAPSNAEANVNANWDATTGDAQILNKPAIIENPVQVIAYATNNTGSTGLSLSILYNGVYVAGSPVGKSYIGTAIIENGLPVPTSAGSYVWAEREGKIRTRLDGLTNYILSGTANLIHPITNYDVIEIEFFASNDNVFRTVLHNTENITLNKRLGEVSGSNNSSTYSFSSNTSITMISTHSDGPPGINKVWGIR